MSHESSVLPAELVAARDQVRDELRRADAKATTLLSLVGATLAGVIALSGRAMPGPATALVWCSVIPVALAAMVLLSVIRPRFGRGAPVPGSWRYAAHAGPAALLESYTVAGPETVAAHVCRLAQITQAKYRRIGTAVTLLIAGLTVLGLALVVAAVTA